MSSPLLNLARQYISHLSFEPSRRCNLRIKQPYLPWGWSESPACYHPWYGSFTNDGRKWPQMTWITSPLPPPALAAVLRLTSIFMSDHFFYCLRCAGRRSSSIDRLAHTLSLSRLSFVGHTPVESVKKKSFTRFHCGKKLLELTAGKVLLLHFVIGCDLVRVLYCSVFLEIKLTSKLVHRLAHTFKISLNWLAVVKPYCGHAQEKPHV